METQGNLADQLEIFFGAASETLCRVYARVEYPQGGDRPQLAGRLTGPTCAYAQTLPATYAFVDRGPGSTLLAEVVVPEPSYWTPEMPHLYRAEVQLRVADKVLGQLERTFGMRALGTSGGKLRYAGKNWVLRAVSAHALPSVELAECHLADTAMLVHDPDDALCEAASHVGVLIVADLKTPHAAALRRLSRWPAVGVVVVPGSTTTEPTHVGPNTILAQRFTAGEPVRPAPWARAAICELAETESVPSGFADCGIPLIALRPASELESIAAGRAACDRLQRDLARQGQFAGYIV